MLSWNPPGVVERETVADAERRIWVPFAVFAAFVGAAVFVGWRLMR